MKWWLAMYIESAIDEDDGVIFLEQTRRGKSCIE
jgi:hypothetical protein